MLHTLGAALARQEIMYSVKEEQHIRITFVRGFHTSSAYYPLCIEISMNEISYKTFGT